MRIKTVSHLYVRNLLLKSDPKPDNIADLKKKMQAWIRNGVQLAWLVDPIQQATYIYNGHEPEIEIKGFDKKLVGEGAVKGFVLDLSVLEID